MPPSNQGRRIARTRPGPGQVRSGNRLGCFGRVRTVGAAAGERRLPRPLRPYAEIFLTPGAWRFSVAGLIGRMPMAMFGLGTVLLISAVTGTYGAAGAVSAVGSVGYAL